jgi:HK97 family phage major capsid protein
MNLTLSARDYLDAEKNKKLAEAKSLAETAATEGRGMTPEERTKAEGLVAEATQLKSRVEDMDANAKFVKDMEGMTGTFNGTPEPAPDGAKSLGDAFVKSDAYKTLVTGIKDGSVTGKWTSGTIEIPGFETKANVTETLSPIVQPSMLQGIQQAAAVALRQLTVADLLMQGTTDSNTVRYLLETTNTNAAAPVTEAAAKPESTITFTQVDEPVRKVATFLPVSDEMLEDVSQIRSYLDNRLRLFVMHAEEDQLLNGSGTAPAIRGLLNRVGIGTATRSAAGVTTGETAGSTTIGNALFAAITAIRVNALVEPDGIVMHPNNWQALRLQKDTAGQYLGGGPMIGAYGNGLLTGETAWGLPVVVTSRIAANTALVGAFGTMAQVFYRGGLTIEASNSHADFFQLNLTALRAERRLALAVYRPAAFYSITALQTP